MVDTEIPNTNYFDWYDLILDSVVNSEIVGVVNFTFNNQKNASPFFKYSFFSYSLNKRKLVPCLFLEAKSSYMSFLSCLLSVVIKTNVERSFVLPKILQVANITFIKIRCWSIYMGLWILFGLQQSLFGFWLARCTLPWLQIFRIFFANNLITKDVIFTNIVVKVFTSSLC